jgi:hypothetical protein
MAGQSVNQGDRYRCPVEGCGCEITVTSAPEMEPTQGFVDCCGHEMEKAWYTRSGGASMTRLTSMS